MRSLSLFPLTFFILTSLTLSIGANENPKICVAENAHHNNLTSLNWVSQKGQTPLSYAIIQKNIPLAKRYIQHGAQLTLPNNQGIDALHLAMYYHLTYLVQYMLDQLQKQNPYNLGIQMVYAGAKGNIKESQKLYCDSRPSSIALATQMAVFFGHDSFVRWMVSQDDNRADYLDNQGNGLLFYSLCSKNYTIAQFLLEKKGWNVNSINNNGASLLQMACQRGNQHFVQLLLDNGASLSQKDNAGNTPLLLACQSDNLSLVQFLVNYGANPYYKNIDQQDALAVASSYNQTAIAQYLLSLSDH